MKCLEDRVTSLSNSHKGLYRLGVVLVLPQGRCSRRAAGKLPGLLGAQHTSLGGLKAKS